MVNVELKTKLNEVMAAKFEAVKKDSGMENDTSVIWLLISKQYDRIERSKRHKVFLPKASYTLLEKAAESRGQSLDEYMDELTLEMLKRAKESVKHGDSARKP